jgi:L-fucose isomerase-like protein
MRIAALALADSTYDIEFASVTAATAFDALGAVAEVHEGRELHTDVAGLGQTLSAIETFDPDAVVVIQATFTDARMIGRLAASLAAPLLLWAFSEPRTSGRLRLNSLCGMNLAAHVLHARGARYGWLYGPPDASDVGGAVEDLVAARGPFVPGPMHPQVERLSTRALAVADEARRRLNGMRVGVLGDPPPGFDSCEYDGAEVTGLTGLTVDRVELDELFSAAGDASIEDVAAVREREEHRLGELNFMDPSELEASLRVHCGLRTLVQDRRWSGVATRCFPECFDGFGGAPCAPQALLSEDGTATSCEADVHGAVTTLMLQVISGEPAFNAELVDVDRETNTGVIWHCGLAPLRMAAADAQPRPIRHPHRHKALANEFPLRTGRVTLARFSNLGDYTMLVGTGEMLDDALPFSGTCGVLRFDHPVQGVIDSIMGNGAEHHYAIVYGDHRESLGAMAARMNIPVLAI